MSAASPEPLAIGFVRVYADEHGETHFALGRLPLQQHIPEAGTLDTLTGAIPVKRAWLRRIAASKPATVPRPSAIHSLNLHLEGAIEVEVGDGTKRIFGPKDLVFVDDVKSKGHITRGFGDAPRVMLVLELGEPYEMFSGAGASKSEIG